MIISRKLVRLKHDEQLPVIGLAILIICVIHLCNKHDEETANQYILTNENSNDQRVCPLYPKTLKGFFRFIDKNKCLLMLQFSGVRSPDMTSDLEWKTIEETVHHVQPGRKISIV